MAKAQFKTLIKSNKRDTSQLKKVQGPGTGSTGLTAGKEQAAFNTTHIKSFYSPVHYKGANSMFTKEALEESMKSYIKTATKNNWNMIRHAEKVGETYVFSWFAKLGTGLAGKQAVNEASRKHIPSLLKLMGQKPAKGDDQIIGGHVEASAFLSTSSMILSTSFLLNSTITYALYDLCLVTKISCFVIS